MPDASAIRDLYDRYERRPSMIDGMVREETERTLRFVSRGEGPGVVLHSNLDEPSAEAAIKAEVDRFRDAGQTFEWKLHDYDQPSDLRGRLERFGFVAQPEEVLVAIDLIRPLPEAPSGVAVRLVPDVDGLDDVHRIRTAAFGRGQAWQRDALHEEMSRAPEALRVYVASIDGQPAAAGWVRLLPESPFATLWGGGTVPGLRRRGAYRALVARRLLEARERGHRYALVDAGPASLPVLERLGFTRVARMTPMMWHSRIPRS
jgi:GNAT superfamily N-acetyltransferase